MASIEKVTVNDVKHFFERAGDEIAEFKTIEKEKRGIAFKIDDSAVFFELLPGAIHVREVGGKFLDKMIIINQLAIRLAKDNGCNFISVTASRPAVARLLKGYGLENCSKTTYIKAV